MAQIALDGNNYDWVHTSYEVDFPRLSASKALANGGHAHHDNGIWKKTFKFSLALDNNGTPGAAKTLRNNLRSSYAKTTPISYTSPDGDTYSVFFYTQLVERFRFDVEVQSGYGLEYIVDVQLIEA